MTSSTAVVDHIFGQFSRWLTANTGKAWCMHDAPVCIVYSIRPLLLTQLMVIDGVRLTVVTSHWLRSQYIDDRTGITKHRKSVLRTEFTNKMLLMSWAQHWVPDRYAQRHAPNALQFIATSVYNALQLRQSNTAHQILTIYIFMCKHCTFTSQRKMFRICSMGQL